MDLTPPTYYQAHMTQPPLIPLNTTKFQNMPRSRHSLPSMVNNNMDTSMVDEKGMDVADEKEVERDVEDSGMISKGTKHIHHTNINIQN